MPVPRFRAIIFDFDGVIIDSLEAHLAAWDAATVQVFGKKIVNLQQLSGYGTKSIAGILANRFGQPAMSKTLTKIKHDILMTKIDQIALFKGAYQVISRLYQQKYPFAIGSNSPWAFISSTLDHHGLSVPVIVGGDQVPRGKPHPDIFVECALKLDIKSSDRSGIGVFEDSLHGLRAAIAAGMIPIGVTSNHSSDELKKAGAIDTFNHVADALNDRWFTDVNLN